MRLFPSADVGMIAADPISDTGEKGTVVTATFVEEEPAHPLLRVALTLVKERE